MNSNLSSSSVYSISGGKPCVFAMLPEPVDREDEHEAVEAEHGQNRSIEVVL
jgi:hypothetical protein